MSSSKNSALFSGFDDPEETDETEDLPDVASELTPLPKETLTQPEDAKARLANIPPQLVEEVQHNPEVLRPVARSMAAINLHNLFTRMQHPAASIKDRMAFQELLNKMSDIGGKEAQAGPGSGFSIVINIPQVGAAQGQVIEAKATRVDEAIPTDE